MTLLASVSFLPYFCDYCLSSTSNRPAETHLDYVAASSLLVFLTRHCLPSLSKLTQHLDPPLLDRADCFLALFDLRLTQRLERPTRHGRSKKHAIGVAPQYQFRQASIGPGSRQLVSSMVRVSGRHHHRELSEFPASKTLVLGAGGINA